MCDLYSYTKPRDAARKLANVERDIAGDMPPLPAILPGGRAPVVRTGADGVRELLMMRWGFPPPLVGRKPRCPYLINVRNTDSHYWRPYLKKLTRRCLVPVTSFSEPDNRNGSPTISTWFAQDESRPVMFFAGIWCEWQRDRGRRIKTLPDEGRRLVFSFLTTDANPDVAPIHPETTPVLLLDERSREMWMNAPWEMARELQRPPAAGALKIVALATKQDG